MACMYIVYIIMYDVTVRHTTFYAVCVKLKSLYGMCLVHELHVPWGILCN